MIDKNNNTYTEFQKIDFTDAENQEIFEDSREKLGYGRNDDFNFYPEDPEEETRALTGEEELALMEMVVKRINMERITTEFFKRRFPDKKLQFEKDCGYFYQWVRRFDSGSPEGYMDDISLKVWNEMKAEMEDGKEFI